MWASTKIQTYSKKQKYYLPKHLLHTRSSISLNLIVIGGSGFKSIFLKSSGQSLLEWPSLLQILHTIVGGYGKTHKIIVFYNLNCVISLNIMCQLMLYRYDSGNMLLYSSVKKIEIK